MSASAPAPERDRTEPFRANADELTALLPDTRPIPVTKLCDRISAPFAGSGRKKLCFREFNDALTRMGLLEDQPSEDGKPRKTPTPLGASVGLLIKERVSGGKSNPVILYSPSAQRYVLDRFDEIMRVIEQLRDEKKGAKRTR